MQNDIGLNRNFNRLCHNLTPGPRAYVRLRIQRWGRKWVRQRQDNGWYDRTEALDRGKHSPEISSHTKRPPFFRNKETWRFDRATIDSESHEYIILAELTTVGMRSASLWQDVKGVSLQLPTSLSLRLYLPSWYRCCYWVIYYDPPDDDDISLEPRVVIDCLVQILHRWFQFRSDSVSCRVLLGDESLNTPNSILVVLN